MDELQIEARTFRFPALAAGPVDGPLVLLLHGFPQSAWCWAAVVETLGAAGVRAVAPTQRGYAATARPADLAGYHVRELTADVVALADACGAAGAPFHLVGHDWGAAVAWQVALRHPERVRSLTAVSVPHPLAFAEALRASRDQAERSAYFGEFRGGDAAAAMLADDAARLRATFAGLPAADDHVARLAADDGAALRAGLAWYAASGADVVRGVGACVVPTTFVWSTDDPSMGRDAAARCGAHVQGPYRFVELAGLDHWIPERAPGQVAALILEQVRGTWPMVR